MTKKTDINVSTQDALKQTDQDIETWKEDSESPEKEFIYNEVLRLISSGGD